MTAKPCKTMGRFTNFADVLSENCKFWPCLIDNPTLLWYIYIISRYQYNVWPPWPAVCLFCGVLGSCCRCFLGGQLWKTHSPKMLQKITSHWDVSQNHINIQQLSGLERTSLESDFLDSDFYPGLRLNAIRCFDDVMLECLVRSGLG